MPRSWRYSMTELPGTLQRSCRKAQETFRRALDDAVRTHPVTGIVTRVLSRRRVPRARTACGGTGSALSNHPVPGLRASAGEAQRGAGRGERRAQRGLTNDRAVEETMIKVLYTPQVRCWRACVDVGLAIEGLRRDADHDQAGTEGSAAREKRLTAVDNSSAESVFTLTSVTGCAPPLLVRQPRSTGLEQQFQLYPRCVPRGARRA
jgi:hypothetical protein